MADSVKNLIRRIQRYHTQKKDEVAPAAAVQFKGDSYTFDGEPIKVTPTALRQLCTVGRIPYDFYTTRLKRNEQVSIFNRIFSKEIGGTKFMFRMAKDELYGIVSPRYGRMDNILIVDLIRAAVKTGFKLQPVKSLLEPDHSKITLISQPDTVGELTPMIEFTNSENGLGSLRLYAGVFRLVCSNGLLVDVVSTRSRWIHIGECEIEPPDFLQVMEVSSDYTNRLEAARGIYLGQHDKVRILQQISNNLGQKVAAEFVKAANTTEYRGAPEMFSLINSLTSLTSLTAAAQQFSAMQATQIEQYASSLLMN